MKRLQSEVTDEQWNKIKAHLPPPPRGQGGPKPIDNRRCFEGILWTLRSGAR
ncbi:transposase [Isoalcanivorax pacificus]|uniref:transposase n=1 Tax=Isoalcanivorax pacificus TaxID=1306787 RepID=UPI0009E3E1F1